MMTEALERAKAAISHNREYLDRLVERLLEVETPRRDEVQQLLAGVRLEDGSIRPARDGFNPDAESTLGEGEVTAEEPRAL